MSDTSPIPYDGELAWIHTNTILLVLHGSQAYGMATPESDIDLKGVAVPPRAYLHGFAQTFEQAQTSEPNDMVIYGVRKFCRLAAECNPNIIEVLFADDEDVRHVTPLGALLREKRQLFLSRKARHTFSGYAIAQLKRIETHRKWLLDPPTAAPARADYDLPQRVGAGPDQISAALSMINKRVEAWDVDIEAFDRAARINLKEKLALLVAEVAVSNDVQFRAAGRLLGFEDNYLDVLDRERRYASARREWKMYNTWKARRNVKRAKMEADFGYDGKHAAHLVRLLKMAREILSEGVVRVKRPDAQELLDIRRGAWPYEDLIAWANDQDKALTELYKSSSLPKKPDREALDALCVEIVERFYDAQPG